MRKLNPKQRVIFYYLALLRRSGEVDLPRAGWQTPKEYDQYLRRYLPEAEEQLETMTDTFIEARYSQHDIQDAQVKDIRSAWDQVRKLLRIRKQSRSN